MDTVALILLAISVTVAGCYWWYRLEMYLDERALHRQVTAQVPLARPAQPVGAEDLAVVIPLRPATATSNHAA